jgi:outer membrane receptor protein involved in Fe transport
MGVKVSVRSSAHWLSLAACCIVSVQGVAQSSAPPPPAIATSRDLIQFDIPAQRADRALTAFARQAGVTLVFRYEDASRRRANALVGRHSLVDGLDILLRDTGLQGAVETSPHLVIRAGAASASTTTPPQETTMNDGTRKPSMRVGFLSGFMALVAGNGTALAQDAARTDGGQAVAPTTLEEVVVTARKRSERQIDVPIALTSISGDALDQRGVPSVGAALSEVPGVNIYDRGGSYKLSIRGISTSLGSNENGYYLDDLPFTGVTVPINPDVRAWDIDRIEVLRGPQGTLFGEGSMGGTVRILTRDPEFNDWDAKLSLFGSSTSDGGTNRGAKAMVNMPLVDDRLALRLAGTKEKFPGWIDNVVTGAQNVNLFEYTSYRAKLRFQPTDALSVGASYWHYKVDGPGGTSTADDRGDADQGVSLAAVIEYSLVGFSAAYDFGPVELAYSFADNSFELPQRGALFGGTLEATIGIDVRSNELRLASQGDGPLQWTLGAYKREAIRRDAFVFALFGLNNTGRTDATSEALFGEATWSLSSAPIDLTLGLRSVREDLKGQEANSGVPTPPVGGKYNSTNPRFIVAWRPNEAWRVYASAAKGYRSGQLQPSVSKGIGGALGIPLPDALSDDSIWTYELGTKASLADNRATFEAAIYQSDWKDVTVRIPLGATGFNGLINSKGIDVQGLEASLTTLLGEAWRLNLNASYSDAVFAGTVPGTGIKDGSPVDDHAKTTASMSLDYTTTVFGDLTGTGRFGVQYASERDFPSFGPPQYLPGDTTTTMELRFGLESRHWGVQLFVDNLTDEDGAISPRAAQQVPGALPTATRFRPRTIGLQVDLKL